MWDFNTGKFVRNLLTGLGSVWQVKFDERRCVAAVQRAAANGANVPNGLTYFEVNNYTFDQVSTQRSFHCFGMAVTNTILLLFVFLKTCRC
jgi:hypothetical protein